MKKRILCLLLSLLVTANVFAGCGKSSGESSESTSKSSESTSSSSSSSQSTSSSSQSTATKTSSSNSGPVKIKAFINIPDYQDAINAFISEYKKVKPNVTINVETMQTGYSEKLKEKLSSGETLDVFSSEAGSEIETYQKMAADLTKQPFVKEMTDLVKESVSSKGKVYGIPITVNTFGMIYNRNILKKNGISAPKTMIELSAAADKLKAAGVQPFTTGYKDGQVFTNVFMHFLNAAEQKDVKGLIKKFSEGKAKISDYPAINDSWFRFVDITVQYGDKKPLESDSKAQISAFASGKAAMIIGRGSWIESEIIKLNPNIKLGIVGYPVSGNPTNSTLIMGTDKALLINKQSKNQKDVLEVFNWLYTSDYGKKWFTGVAKAIPPIKNAPFPDMQISDEMKTYLSSKKAGELSINYSQSTFHQKFGEIMQEYVAGTYNKDQAVKAIESEWKKTGAAKQSK